MTCSSDDDAVETTTTTTTMMTTTTATNDKPCPLPRRNFSPPNRPPTAIRPKSSSSSTNTSSSLSFLPPSCAPVCRSETKRHTDATSARRKDPSYLLPSTDTAERGRIRRRVKIHRRKRGRKRLLRFVNCRILADDRDGGSGNDAGRAAAHDDFIEANVVIDVRLGKIVGIEGASDEEGKKMAVRGEELDEKEWNDETLEGGDYEDEEEKKEEDEDEECATDDDGNCDRDEDDLIETVDCQGGILCPGFIDIQINGAYGVDFSDPSVTPLQVRYVATKLTSHGVTSFCPTLISCSTNAYRQIIPKLGRMCENRNYGNRDACGERPANEDGRIEGAKDDSSGNGDVGDGGGNGGGASILGIHLEGPFFAPSKRGAHPAPHMRDPIHGLRTVLDTYGLSTSSCPPDDEINADNDDDDDDDDDDDALAKHGIRIVTLAPEREGALQASAELVNRGIVVAMGHTDCTLDEALEGVEVGGATLVTHLFNAMKPFHHREPGLVGILASDLNGDGRCGSVVRGEAAAATTMRCGRHWNSARNKGGHDLARARGSRKPYWSVIADGIHVHPSAVRMARCAHPAGAVLVTDAMSAMGLGDGVHTLGNTVVEIKRARATVEGTDTLAGSVASMDQCVRHYERFSGCKMAEALRAATVHPAKVLGIDEERGRMRVGCIADLVLLSAHGDRRNYCGNGANWSVVGTWVKGCLAYQAADDMTATGNKRRRIFEGSTFSEENAVPL